MSSINFILKKNHRESILENYEQILKIPGVVEIVQKSERGRELLLNIKFCKSEIEKIERGEEAATVGIGKVEE